MIAVMTSSTYLFDLIFECFEADGISCVRFDDELRVARSMEAAENSVVLVDVLGNMESKRSRCIYLTSRLGSKTPVVLLNVQPDRASIIDAFDVGANDVVLAPASIGEIHARTLIALRGGRSISERIRQGSISIGSYTIDRRSQRAIVDGNHIRLTAKELEIVWLLFLYKNEEISRERIAMTIWGVSEDVVARSIEQYIYRLRIKLDLNGKFGVSLLTVYARGYRIAEVEMIKRKPNGYDDHVETQSLIPG